MSAFVEMLVRETWTHEVVNDEEKFKATLVKLGETVMSCRRKGDIAGANNWLECLTHARIYAHESPFATLYAHWLALISSTMADWLVGQHKYVQAIDVVTRAWETLDAKDARREATGLPPVPSNVSRFRLLGILADVKWRMPDDQYRDVVFTPPQHVQAWLRYATLMQADLNASVPPADTPLIERQRHLQRDRLHTESLLWSGLWTACCAFRYCRSDLVKLVREFNILHRRHYRCAGLALAERHWLEDAPLAPESPLYWHFEIAKQWLADQKARAGNSSRKSTITMDELEELYSQLLLSVDHWTEGRPDKVYSAGLELDYKWMREELRSSNEASQVDVAAIPPTSDPVNALGLQG